ncbi:hypothetical protein HORIV_52270 [Vreelandella olivaria]|uniref:Uncharacterized protein n=1 Tax=Vreelandella olivaria TaxID=390919 RepID=A0ABN5X0Y3_9GAMM|nr:hypothetical protein HORIV_52270 [Halomonas olivaria]
MPIIQHAWQALKLGNPFTIEMLMSIAALGALAINAAAEAAVVVFLFAVGRCWKALPQPKHAAVFRRFPS